MSQNSSQNDFSDEPLLSLPVTPSSQRYQVLDEHVDEYVLEECDLIHEISNPKINKLKKKIKNYIFLITQLKKLCEITVIC